MPLYDLTMHGPAVPCVQIADLLALPANTRDKALRQHRAALHQTAPYAWTLFVHDVPVARFFCPSGSWALAAHPQHRPMAMRTIADTIAMCTPTHWVNVMRETVTACAERMRPTSATILAFPTR